MNKILRIFAVILIITAFLLPTYTIQATDYTFGGQAGASSAHTEGANYSWTFVNVAGGASTKTGFIYKMTVGNYGTMHNVNVGVFQRNDGNYFTTHSYQYVGTLNGIGNGTTPNTINNLNMAVSAGEYLGISWDKESSDTMDCVYTGTGYFLNSNTTSGGNTINISHTLFTASSTNQLFITASINQSFPVINTDAASSVASTSARLNSSIDSMGDATSGTATFEYGTTTGYGSSISANTSTVYASGANYADLTGLSVTTTYHYRYKVVDNNSNTIYGYDQSFTTDTAVVYAPTVSLTTSDVTQFGFDMDANVTDLGGASPVEVYFQYYESGTQNVVKTPSTYITGTGGVSYRAYSRDGYPNGYTVLKPGTNYYYRVVAIGTLTYTSTYAIQATSAETLVTGYTMDAANILNSQADLKGILYSVGSADGVYSYFEWGSTTQYGHTLAVGSNAIANDTVVYGGDHYNFFTATLSDLDTNQTYHYRLVMVPGTWHDAVSFLGIVQPGYYSWDYPNLINGNDISFSTLNSSLVITTGQFPNFGGGESWNETTVDSANLWGTIDQYPEAPSVVVYFKYGKTSGDLDLASGTQNITGTGRFEATITGLDADTIYYYQAVGGYGSNVGPSLIHGAEHYFKTKPVGTTPTPVPTTTPGLTTVRTIGWEYITNLSGYDGGAIKLKGYLDNGGGASTLTGFKLGTTQDNALPKSAKLLLGSGNFELIVDHIYPATTYWFQAYAIGNNMATGQWMSFMETGVPTPTQTTAPGPKVAPKIVTKDATNVTGTTATLNGEITELGNAMLVTIGFQYGTTTDYGTWAWPGDAHGPIPFSADVTGLKVSTTYHYKAVGLGGLTGYGADMQFRTGTSVSTGTSTNVQKNKVDNTVNNYFDTWGLGSPGMHMFIIVVCMILAYVVLRKHKILAVCAVLLVMGAGIFIFENIRWMVILLALVGALGLGGLVLGKRRAEG